MTNKSRLAATDNLSAAAESFQTKSKKGGFTVRFQMISEDGSYRASIHSAEGSEVFEFEEHLAVENDSLLWNESGSALPFTAGTPFLRHCYILFVTGDQWAIVKGPPPEKGWDNFYQVPKAWDGQQLTLEVDGPHAGKVDGYWFSGKMKIDLSAPKARTRTVSENIRIVEQDGGGTAD